MLKDCPLGGELGSIIFHCILFHRRKNILEWYSLSITKEEKFCSSHRGHSVKGNSIESASFFLLTFEEKRAERHHLLTDISPVLGFSGYILCLFLYGV